MPAPPATAGRRYPSRPRHINGLLALMDFYDVTLGHVRDKLGQAIKKRLDSLGRVGLVQRGRRIEVPVPAAVAVGLSRSKCLWLEAALLMVQRALLVGVVVGDDGLAEPGKSVAVDALLLVAAVLTLAIRFGSRRARRLTVACELTRPLHGVRVGGEPRLAHDEVECAAAGTRLLWSNQVAFLRSIDSEPCVP